MPPGRPPGLFSARGPQLSGAGGLQEGEGRALSWRWWQQGSMGAPCGVSPHMGSQLQVELSMRNGVGGPAARVRPAHTALPKLSKEKPVCISTCTQAESLSRVRLSATPGTITRQVPLNME